MSPIEAVLLCVVFAIVVAVVFSLYLTQATCDHKWTGQRIGAPGECVDYVEFCEICGMEKPGSEF
jgi:hypothetical protein